VIRKLTDIILLNASTVSSSGLYNGKAGMALALFEAAKYLHDEKVEDRASLLLQESLIIEKNDYSFENGLSGIGYVLLYLIENGFLDADFNEIFDKQFDRIIKSFADIENNPSQLFSSFNVVYFLEKVKKKDQNDSINKIIQKIFEGIELYLSLQFFDFTNLRYYNSKSLVLRVFDQYLKLVDFVSYSNFSRILVDLYAGLYRNNKITSNYSRGYLLENVLKDNLDEYEDIIRNNKHYGLLNLYNDYLLLYEQIDVSSYLLKKNIGFRSN